MVTKEQKMNQLLILERAYDDESEFVDEKKRIMEKIREAKSR